MIGAAREDRVKSLVYIAALAPDEGATVAKVFYRDEPHPNAPKLAPDAHGFLWMPGFRMQLLTKLQPTKRASWLRCSGQLRFSVLVPPSSVPLQLLSTFRYLIVNELDFYSQASIHRILQKQLEE